MTERGILPLSVFIIIVQSRAISSSRGCGYVDNWHGYEAVSGLWKSLGAFRFRTHYRDFSMARSRRNASYQYIHSHFVNCAVS